MRTISKLMVTIAISMISAVAFAACDYPKRIDIPNGAEATKEEMIAGQRAIKTYMDAMNTYLDCIESETEAAKSPDESPEITAERKALLSKRHNAAIDEMETVAAEFNAQVRAYKAKGDQ